MMTKKEMTIDFLKRVVAGDSREAFRLYAASGFKHHNAGFRGDADTLMEAMEASAKMNPQKTFEIQRALEDGALVAVHSFLKQQPEEPGYAVIHIFRFESGKIAELWDFAQPVPKDTINENGMF